MKILFFSVALFALAVSQPAVAESTGNAEPDASRYLQVSVDNVVIQTRGLEAASADLAASIEVLAQAIETLSRAEAQLSEAERTALLQAVRSVDDASQALAGLARTLPETATELTRQLPQAISNAREPIAELSSGLQSARDGIYAITESLPQATENAKALVNSTLDAALWRLTLYSIVLFALIALLLVGVIWFVYRQYLDPLVQKLDALTGAPEHFASMAGHMENTSANLLALQAADAVDESTTPADDGEPEPAADAEPSNT